MTITHVLGDTGILTGRSMRHILRSPDTILTTAVTPVAASIACVRRARSLSIHCLPVYACAKVSVNSTGSSPTIARTGVLSTAARSQRSARSPYIVTRVSPSVVPA